MSTQGDRQASWRTISGTSTTYAGDQMAAMATELEAHSLPVPDTIAGRMVAWLQLRLGSSDDNLNNLLVAWAESEGAYNSSSIGSFEPTPGPE
jgi:hypothetical protein